MARHRKLPKKKTNQIRPFVFWKKLADHKLLSRLSDLYLHTYICFCLCGECMFRAASKKPKRSPGLQSIPLPSRGFNDVLRSLRAVGTGSRIAPPPNPSKISKDQGLPPDFQTILRSATGLRGRLGPVDCCLF